ncbi:MAG: hypothetical protein ACKVU2_10260 [Saprospiraceae bacterium]
MLATISYEELKTLALAYPYAHNLRYLLVLKSNQGDKNSDFGRNLAMAATYSLDRKRLFLLLAPNMLAPKPVEQEGLVLELRPIETVQRELGTKIPLAKKAEREIPLNSEQTQARQAPHTDTRPVNDSSEAAGFEENASIQSPPMSMPTPVVQPAATPGEVSFGAWISRFQPPTLADTRPLRAQPARASLPKQDPDEVGAGERVAGNTKQPGSPQALAERSVTESKTIVSETLAKLYARQGYSDKAIDMYERLCLAFPDNCANFAAEIEKLKK